MSIVKREDAAVSTPTREQFYDACRLVQMMGVTEFRVTPELFVAMARHHDATMEKINGEVAYLYRSDDDLIESGRVPYFRGSPFKLAKEYK